MSPSHRPTANDTVGHDDGLAHDHHWARETGHRRRAYPIVADAARVATPSSVTHDDAHYGAF